MWLVANECCRPPTVDLPGRESNPRGGSKPSTFGV